MKTRIAALLLLAVGTTVQAQEQCTADGKWINLNHGGMTANLTGMVLCQRDGKPSQELPYRDGKLHGTAKRFGGLASDQTVHTEYVDGKRNGFVRTFDAAGRLVSEVGYRDDREFGPARQFHPNGKVRRLVARAEDERNALVEEWDAEGRLTRASCGTSSSAPIGRGECRYRDMTGVLKTVHPNGQPAQSITLAGGLAEGELLTHDSSGRLLRRETLAQGRLHGLAQTLHPNGKVDQEATYREGLLAGPRKRFFETGQLAEEWTFQGDRLVGERAWYMNGERRAETTRTEDRVRAVGYHDNGKQRFTGEFSERVASPRPPAVETVFTPLRLPRDGASQTPSLTEWGATSAFWSRLTAEGVHREFYESGAPARETTFVRGRRDGVHRAWYENGRLGLEETYVAGRLTARKSYDREGRLEVDETVLPDGSRRRTN